MSSLGYVSKSTSPVGEFSAFIRDNEKTPRTNSPQRDLRIQVPPDTYPLGDAFHFKHNEPSVSPDFTSITQLPTPVMPSGAFVPRSPEKGLPAQIDVRKRGSVLPGDRSRIVSAFAPETHSKMLVDAPSPANSSQTRHISNPSAFPISEPSSQIPSPPSEAEFALQGRVLLAPQLHKSYVCEDVVGTGSFSTVVAARDTGGSHSVVAVKIISFPKDGYTSVSSFRSFIVRELGILSHLHHPCIIRLLDYNVSASVTQAEIDGAYEGATSRDDDDLTGFADTQQCFFLEYCPGGNLFNWVSQNHSAMAQSASFWRLTARVVAEIVSAVAHMHKRRIIHRDIKLENILLNREFDCADIHDDPRLSASPVATITDFGLSKRLTRGDDLLTTKCGSQDYVSPELLMGLQYSGKLLDAWAIGVLVYSIIENRLPFDLPPPELMQSSGISPSVLKRRRSKHSPAHRIAMIDWNWYRGAAMQQDNVLDSESKKIVANLQALVEVCLVRKERRMTVEAILDSETFAWIKASVPSHFYS